MPRPGTSEPTTCAVAAGPVVNNVDGRLVSAILPRKLRRIYRDGAGKIRTVKSALAFEDPQLAQTWMNGWKRTYPDLELWTAEGTPAERQNPFIVHCVETDSDWRSIEAADTIISKEEWSEIEAKLARKRKLGSIKVHGLRAYLAARPEGSVECTDFRLVAKIEILPNGNLVIPE